MEHLIISLNDVDIVLDSWFKRDDIFSIYERKEITNTFIKHIGYELSVQLRMKSNNYYIYFFGLNSKLLYDLYIKSYNSNLFIGDLESAKKHVDRFLTKINKLKFFL